MSAARELSNLAVLVVDCQTTGATPVLGAVLELGWCVARASTPELEQAQAHWLTLSGDHSVSRHIRRLTGFDERRLVGALAPEAAWQRLRMSLPSAPMPTVIHFATFELRFLRDFAARFEPQRPFPFDAVCVHAIACRLYPELPRRSLRALAGYLGHGLDLARRSLGHVEATAFIWRKLCAELETRGVRHWEELGDWLREAPRSARPKKRRYPIATSRYRELPDSPGVYRFVRSNGDVLYVGKAASLKQRVKSHFSAASTREHTVEMLTQVSDVLVTLTPTALEAAVLENESIKALRPPYNLQLTAYDREAWFATRGFDSASTSPDDVYRIGPLPSKLSLSPLAALMSLASGAPSTRSLRARAVATAERWAPDEAVFGAGFDELVRAQLAAGASPALSARRNVLGVAKRLVSSRLVAKLLEEAPRDDALSDTAPNGEAELGAAELELRAPASWDPERVTRHLERALAQAYQLLRRAQWLLLLHDCAIVYREPGSDRARQLIIASGDLVEASDFGVERAIIAPERPRWRTARVAFDRAKYDRLRVLSSELKRVRRDGGNLAVYVAPARPLGERVLAGIFGYI